MVHKKSEYRLQFHLLAEDLRKKIWQENIQSRETCRLLNRADHYWSYQLTDERCECDNGEDDENESALPPHRLKHKILLAKYDSAKSKHEGKDVTIQEVSGMPSTVQKKHEEQATVQEKDVLYSRDMGVQTPDWGERRVMEDSGHEIENLMQNLSTTSPEPLKKNSLKKEEKAITPYLPSDRSTTLQIPSSPRRVSVKTDRHSGTSAPLGHCSEIREQLSSSRRSSPSRTSQKAYFEDKKSPFASFGWNDSDRNIGEKKTYNVYAPVNEVYPPALLALKRRREEVEKYLATEAQKRRQGLMPQSGKTVNHSSIWMSEYQDKFTYGKNKYIPDGLICRPASAPPCRRPVSLKYC